MACKDVMPEPIEDSAKAFDITKYAIIGKKYFGAEQIPYIIALNANGKARREMPGDFVPYIYTYKDGILTLDQIGGNLIRVRINQDTITSFESTIEKFASYQLIKIPNTNQLIGTSFGGVWKMIVAGQSAPQLSIVKFTDTHYGEDALYSPTPDKDYSVFYNIAAKTFNNTTKDETLWILINGKLEGHRYNLTSKKIYSGTFIKN